MIHKDQICGCHEIREQCDQETGQTQIRSGDRRKVIIIRLFHHIKDRGGQDHGRRGIVHQDHQIAFQHLGCHFTGLVAKVVVVEPQSDQTAGFHHACGAADDRSSRLHDQTSQSIHLNGTDPFPDLRKKFRIHTALHITQYDICSGILTGIKHFHMKIRTTDPAADQCCIEYHCLHEAVLGPPEYLVLVRLLHPSGGIGSGIDQHRLFITVQ